MSHTPRPWINAGYAAKVSNFGGYQQKISSIATHATVGKVYGDDRSVLQANANLITAAPELLAALRECFNMMDHVRGRADYLTPADLDEVEAKVRAAIAKAEGK